MTFTDQLQELLQLNEALVTALTSGDLGSCEEICRRRAEALTALERSGGPQPAERTAAHRLAEVLRRSDQALQERFAKNLSELDQERDGLVRRTQRLPDQTAICVDRLA